jgi:hypothetical protein
MSFCRSRSRPRLGGSGNQKLEGPNGLHLSKSESWSGGNARAESAATARITRFSTAVHTAPKAEKTKRVSLNPQPVIDAKVAAVKELGLKLTYAGRQWKCGDRTFTSLEFSRYDVEGFKKLFAK